MRWRELGVVSPGSLAERLRTLRVSARRAAVFAALTLSGIWRTAALELDLLLARLAREWGGRARVDVRGLQPIGQLIGLLARGAAAGRKLTERHARFAARVDDRLFRLAS